MKRGFWRSQGAAVFVSLCLFFFATGAAAAANAPSKAHLLYASNASWTSDAIASNASAGATLHTTNCVVGFPGDAITFSAAGEAVVKDFAKLQCGAGALPFGVVDLDYTGNIDVGTEATYHDAKGSFNFVYVQALTDAQKLPANSSGRLVLQRVMSTDQRSTFLAIVGSSWLTVKYFAGDNPFLATDSDVVNATGATWYEIKSQLPIGRAEITRGVTSFGIPGGDGSGTDVYVVGFVGKREGGSPRVELPTFSAAP